jgi:hypothetical protein
VRTSGAVCWSVGVDEPVGMKRVDAAALEEPEWQGLHTGRCLCDLGRAQNAHLWNGSVPMDAIECLLGAGVAALVPSCARCMTTPSSERNSWRRGRRDCTRRAPLERRRLSLRFAAVPAFGGPALCQHPLPRATSPPSVWPSGDRQRAWRSTVRLPEQPTPSLPRATGCSGGSSRGLRPIGGWLPQLASSSGRLERTVPLRPSRHLGGRCGRGRVGHDTTSDAAKESQSECFRPVAGADVANAAQGA